MNSILRAAAFISVLSVTPAVAFDHDSLFEDRFSDRLTETVTVSRPAYSDKVFALVPAYRPAFIEPPIYPAQVFRFDEYADTLYAPGYSPYRVISITVRDRIY